MANTLPRWKMPIVCAHQRELLLRQTRNSVKRGRRSRRLAQALVFISATDSADLVKNLQKVDGVSEAHSSLGLYDAIVMVQGESFRKVNDIVSKQIRSLDNVKSTLTLTLVEAPV